MLERKEVTVSSGYVGIRQLTPFDDIILSGWLGDQKDDILLVNNYVIAMGVEYIDAPPPSMSREDFLIPHPTEPDNFIEVDDTEAEKDKDGKYPKKKVLNPQKPHNFIVDRTKCVRINFEHPKSLDELQKRMRLSSADWYIVAEASNRLNEPNPVLLGK